jgi:hypothetical protein
MAGAAVKVRLVAGDARTPGHVNGTIRAGIATTTVDVDGNFTLEVPSLNPANTAVFPAQAYYSVVTGGGRWPKYEWKVKPLTDTTYVLSDPTIGGETEDLLPPEFVQIEPDITPEDIEAIVIQYFIDNPIDVTAQVDAANLAHPPLYADQKLVELVDPADAAQARLNIGAASDTDTGAVIAALTARIEALELVENTDPALRLTDLGGGALVTAPSKTTATITDPGGVITITLT